MSTYYYKPKISRLECQREEATICDAIEKIRLTHHMAGYRPLLPYLKREGIKIGERRLRRIMRENKLHIKPKKRFIKTTNSKHKHRVYPNLIKGKEVDGIDQVWVADITYIRIFAGFVYLAVILDVYSRRVVGWDISKNIDRFLTVNALKQAIQNRAPLKGLVHHSDRGVQYLCDDYVDLLDEHEILISNSAKGNPYDNAFAESFMKTLKTEELDLSQYETIVDVIESLPKFIEDVYNTKRVHSRLGYLTPTEFEEKIKLETSRSKLKL